jgi:glucokinase
VAKLRGGIDLGGTKIQAAVVGPRGKVHGEARLPTPTSGGPADVVREMAAALTESVRQARVEPSELSGVGVGAPGDAGAEGVVSSASNLPGWSGSYPLADELSAILGAPVRVGGDVQVAVEAEFRLGAGRPYRSILGVFWGTGVGGGVILGGKPWIGRGNAGEIGHTVIERGGARCACGRRGCLEAYAGRGPMEAKARREHESGTKTRLFKIMKERGHDRLKSSVWQQAVEEEDKLATHLIDRAVKALGTGIASAVNLLDVEAVILGGGLGVRFGEPYLRRIEKEAAKHLFVDDRPPAMHVAALGDLGGAIGASLLVGSRPRVAA